MLKSNPIKIKNQNNAYNKTYTNPKNRIDSTTNNYLDNSMLKHHYINNSTLKDYTNVDDSNYYINDENSNFQNYFDKSFTINNNPNK